MKNKVCVVLILSVIFFFHNSILADESEEFKIDKEKSDKDLRIMYKNTYKGMVFLSKAIHNEESASRTGHVGVGVSGDLLFRIQSWQNTPLMDGFVDFDLNFTVNTHFNLVVSAGYHKTSASQVTPVSGVLQWVAGSDDLGMFPSSIGIEIGAVSYISDVTDESKTSFKIGICRYQYFTKNFALINNIDFITPSFKDNNFDIKFGMVVFL